MILDENGNKPPLNKIQLERLKKRCPEIFEKNPDYDGSMTSDEIQKMVDELAKINFPVE